MAPGLPCQGGGVSAAGGGAPHPRRPQPGGADDGDEGGAAQPPPLQAGGRHQPGGQPQHLEVSGHHLCDNDESSINLFYRQLETYEVEFTVLQEEQSCNQSEVARLRSDLDAKEAELREARAEVTGLRQRMEVTEAEERLVRMVTALEQLRVEDISEEMRSVETVDRHRLTLNASLQAKAG